MSEITCCLISTVEIGLKIDEIDSKLNLVPFESLFYVDYDLNYPQLSIFVEINSASLRMQGGIVEILAILCMAIFFSGVPNVFPHNI